MEENKLCYRTNIPGLFTSLGLPYNPSDWRLFIDSSKRNLKGVLLHNGIKYPSIPFAHPVHLKEFYDNMELLLEAIKYSEYQRLLVFLWICKRASQRTVVFSVSGIVELYPSITSRRTGGSKSTFVPGEHSLKENPLVDMNKVLLPPLHIKLGLMKNFVKALPKKKKWCCLPIPVYCVPRS